MSAGIGAGMRGARPPVRARALRRAVAAESAAAAAALPTIVPSGAVPLYRQAKRAVLQFVESGACPPGAALPSETELAVSLGVSIGTLRRAVDELVADHILVRHQGRGTFVATHDAERFLFQFFHVERADGRREQPRVDPVSFERQRAEPEAAEALRLREGEPVFVAENRLALEGRAIVYDRIVLPALLFKGLTEKRWRERPGTIYQLYQSEFAITVLRAAERARAVAADRTAARMLGVAAGAPVMQVRRTALTFGDKPVEWRLSTINTARHDYVHMLSRPLGQA